MSQSSLLTHYGPWALITGASSGIGRGYARYLASLGFGVVLVARRRELLEELGCELQSEYNVDTRVVVADLSVPESVTHIAAAVSDIIIGLLINNAGAALYGSFFNDDADYHAGVLNVNVVCPITLTRLVCEGMKNRRRGGIMFTSSTASALIPYFATYASSKSCISNFSKLLGFELRPFGVDVLCVEPGFVETEMGLKMVKDVDVRRLLPKSQIVTTEHVVISSLKQLGVSTLYTPGPMTRVSITLTRMMPIKLRFHVLSRQVRSVMSPKLRATLRPTR